MADLASIQQTLGVFFNDLSFLQQALVHSSYSNENPSFAPISNERLEFLGDAVLGLIIAEKIYQDSPQLSEGEMTELRAALVCQDTLARMARVIRLGHYLLLGKGEKASGGQHNPANLAKALEAVIAAIYLDQEPVTARDVILKLFNEELQKAISHGVKSGYKSQLQELIQAKKQQIPVYQLIEATGPAHERKFTVEVRVGDTVLGHGTGKSKKAAEIEAARSALPRLTANFTQ